MKYLDALFHKDFFRIKLVAEILGIVVNGSSGLVVVVVVLLVWMWMLVEHCLLSYFLCQHGHALQKNSCLEDERQCVPNNKKNIRVNFRQFLKRKKKKKIQRRKDQRDGYVCEDSFLLLG